MQETGRLWLRRRLLAGVCITFCVYVALLLSVNTEGLLLQLRRFPTELLLPLALLKPVSWFCRFLVWQHFLDVVRVRDAIGATNSALLYLAGFTMAVSPGKSAELLKALVLRRWTNLPLNQGMPIILAERVVESLSVLFLAAVSLLFGAAAFVPGPARLLLLLAAGLLAAGLLFIQSWTAQRQLLRVLGRLPLVWRAQEWLAGFLDGSSDLLRPRHLLRVMVPGVLATAGDAAVLLVILRGFDVPFSTELLLQSLLIVSLSPLIGALSGLPNGAGITELSVSAMLLTIVAPQHPAVTVSSAGAIALIESFFHKWLRVLIGLLVALLYRQRLFGAGTLTNRAASRAAPTAAQEKVYELES